MKKKFAVLAVILGFLLTSVVAGNADNFYMKKTLSQLQAMRANPGDRAIVHTDAGVVTFYAYIAGTWTEMSTFNKGGGTLFSSYAVGDLLYANTTSTLAKLADVAAGKYLRSGGVTTAPVWSTLALPNAATKGDVFFASATNTMGALADVAAGSYLRSGGVGADPVWSTVTLPNAATTGDLWYASATSTMTALADVAAGSFLRSGGVGTAPVWSTVTVPNAAAQGDLLYASVANTWTQLTKSASATRYLSNTGADNAPAWAQVALADGVSGTLPATNGGTGATSYAIGDILYADSTTTLAKLADVAVNQVLVSGGVGAAPAWSTNPVTATHALTTPRPTPGSGTGVTVNDAGSLRTQVYKVSVAKTNFTSAGVTHDLTLATLPAKSIVHSVIADVTEQFACTAVCTSATLSSTVGISTGGVEFLESFDLDNAVAAFGLADAEVGTKLDAAGATNAGYVSWAGTPVIMRATSGTGNWGDGASATNLSAGAVTFYILYSILP